MLRNITMLLVALLLNLAVAAQEKDKGMLTYRAELGVTAGGGDFAPLWLSANRYGLPGIKPNNGYLRAGMQYEKSFSDRFSLKAALDLAGGYNLEAKFVVQQAYVDLKYRKFVFSFGSKERAGFPLEKNTELSSGMLVEGMNTRPIPQVRIELPEYLYVPGTKQMFAIKGHLAYGVFMQNSYQRNSTSEGNIYTTNVLYHSKSIMFKVGNEKKFPLSGEFGLLMTTQFGGTVWEKKATGDEFVLKMPHGVKAFLKAFFPISGGKDTPEGEQVNVEGNHLGSWNFALSYTAENWKARLYYEHFFDDHSQMFFEYGRWKDGHIGIELTLPKNRYLSTLLWEGFSSYDQTGSILHDKTEKFPEQVSGNDNYYNHYFYNGWAHAGRGIGYPMIVGPAYNTDGSQNIRSTRQRSIHFGLSGNPCDEVKWRILLSHSRNWGRYYDPYTEVKKQFSSLYEVTYMPRWAEGWNASVALGIDRGSYLGNNTGAMLTIKKTGKIF